MASKPSLVLKRRLKAPAEKVYQAWTHPEQMTLWWGVTPHNSRKPIAEADLRVGGRFRVQFWGKNDEHHSVSGIYREVVPNRKLVFSWAWQSTPERESQVTIDLNPVADGTLLTLTHEQFFSQQACDDHRVGWEHGLDMLEAVFA
jgi:uncharacterized protein YndB with AHSA1/START domain